MPRAQAPVNRAIRHSFDWTLYFACNYRCPYCYFDGHWEELAKLNRAPSLETVIESWGRVHDKYGESEILINGGEPTVYPRFMELMAALGRWHRWYFNTNLWWGLDRWRAFADKVDPSRGRLQFSFHPAETGDLDGFADKAAAVKRLGFGRCNVCVVAYPPHLPKLRDYRARFKRNDLAVNPQPFVGRFGGKVYPRDYSPDEKKMLRELNGEMDSPLLPEMNHALGDASPRGKPCRSGQYYCHVNQSGDVFRCTQVEERPENKIGNLYEGFDFLPEPTPCPRTFCRCGESGWLVEKYG